LKVVDRSAIKGCFAEQSTTIAIAGFAPSGLIGLTAVVAQEPRPPDMCLLGLAEQRRLKRQKSPRAANKAMTQTLIQHGNDLALVLDAKLLAQLQISPDTPLELTTDGNQIVITPVRTDARREQLAGSIEKMNDRFGDDLRRLAE
jgi:antitoxin component of MazEF toxin-antitoxin module